ncbi:MAG: DUF932 domain-containing protein [Blautia sp.]|nr:DUF932 domain-containing protein [Blautia sp.]
MKAGRPLAQVLQELKKQNSAKRDYVAPAPAFGLEEDGRTFFIRNEARNEKIIFGTTPLFHRQVAASLNIPSKYYDLMQEKKPELLAENVNEWFRDRDQAYMVRTLDYGEGQVARALLSDRYRRIDNLEIATAVLPCLAGRDEIEIVSSEVTPERLFIKYLNKRVEGEVRPGDLVQAGGIISNSEVGLGAVSVKPLLYRLVCSNGAVVDDFATRKTHVGRAAKSLEDSFVAFSEEAQQAEDAAFLLKIRDAVSSSYDEARFHQMIDKYREAADEKITGRVQDVVELTGKEYGLTVPEQDGILKYLIEGGDLSLYGLSNAVTRFSQDVESYDRATQMEAIGWNVATMPPRLWKEMNG